MRVLILLIGNYLSFWGAHTFLWREKLKNLSQLQVTCTLQVIVITHAYGNRIGVRHMSSFLKVTSLVTMTTNSIGYSQVYYLPIHVFFKQCTVPTMFTTLPLIRDICIREQVDILHGHGVCECVQ